jgi:hypothetical protein
MTPENAVAEELETRKRAPLAGQISALPEEPELPFERVEKLDERPARWELRRQIASLETSLGRYAEDTRPEREPVSLPRDGHVADLGELEAIRDALVDRLERAHRAAERRDEQHQRARARIEQMVDEPAAHAWERVSNEQLGEPGCRHWHAVPRGGPLGMLFGWWRVKVSSGCPLAVAA